MKKSNLTKLFFYTLLGLNALIATNLIYSANEPPPTPRGQPRGQRGREEVALRDDDDSLYDRNQRRYDWDYQDNWRYNPNAYLSTPGAQGTQYYYNNNGQYRYQNQNSDPNRYQYQQVQVQAINPPQRGNVYYPDQWKNWNFRTNWSESPSQRDAFLRGEPQDDYYEQNYSNRRAPRNGDYYYGR